MAAVSGAYATRVRPGTVTVHVPPCTPPVLRSRTTVHHLQETHVRADVLADPEEPP